MLMKDQHPSTPDFDFTLTVLRGAVENANEAFITIDEDHKVLFYNQAAQTIFGYAVDEVLGRDLNMILGPTCPDDHPQKVRRYIDTRQPRLIGHDTELTATRKNGEAFPALISFSVAEVLGRLYFTATVRDLTEKKAYEAKIKRAERLAALGGLVAEITHEIKNPLMLIGGFAANLAKKNPDDQDRQKLEIIVDEVKRLEGLIGEMRDLYGSKGYDLGVFDVNELLRETLALAQDYCEEHGIQTRLDLTRAQPLILGDWDRLKQVFLNIIRNAMDATGEAGVITIHSSVFHNRVFIVISDNGPGFDEKIIEQAFTPFVTSKPSGSGLGLPISKRIVEDHEGANIYLNNNEDGPGAEVTITFPLAEPEETKENE